MAVTARSLGVLTVCFLAVFVSHSAVASGFARCEGFCDPYGNYRPPKTCYRDRYCCGTVDFRFCCSNHSIAVNLPPNTSCLQRWWDLQWRVILGMLISLLVMLGLIACCYYCCGYEGTPCCERRARNQRNRPNDSRRGGTVSVNVDEPEPRRPSLFDANNPYAFQPPSYESLPKDPPKYADIFQGAVNQAYVPDGGQPSSSSTSSAAPPAYSPNDPAPQETPPREVQATAAASEAPPPAYSPQTDSEAPVSATQSAQPDQNQSVSVAPNSSSASASASTVEQTTSSNAGNDAPTDGIAAAESRDRSAPPSSNGATGSTPETPTTSTNTPTSSSGTQNTTTDNAPVAPRSSEGSTGSVRTHSIAENAQKNSPTTVETH